MAKCCPYDYCNAHVLSMDEYKHNPNPKASLTLQWWMFGFIKYAVLLFVLMSDFIPSIYYSEHPAINGFKCLSTVNGFSRVRLKIGFPPILLVGDLFCFAKVVACIDLIQILTTSYCSRLKSPKYIFMEM